MNLRCGVIALESEQLNVHDKTEDIQASSVKDVEEPLISTSILEKDAPALVKGMFALNQIFSHF